MTHEMKKQTEKGFTLIELMIVVAIIGILAAIAIPQFASYRIKAFNSAAVSDIHTARLSEEALFADYQFYGSTALKGAIGSAAVLTGASINPVVATKTAGQEAPLSISKNVTLIAEVDGTNVTAAVIAQHLNGNKTYTAQTDFSGLYWGVATPGTALAAAVVPLAGTPPLGTAM